MSNKKFLEGGCPTNASEEANVTVPVAIRAFSNVGDVEITCGGTSINRNSDYTPGIPGAISRFTVSQRLYVDIPLAFGAEVEVGEGHVVFASSADNKENC